MSESIPIDRGSISTNAILDENGVSGLFNVYPNIPAPIATTVSGFIVQIASFLKYVFTMYFIHCNFVDPPTSIIYSKSDLLKLDNNIILSKYCVILFNSG